MRRTLLPTGVLLLGLSLVMAGDSAAARVALTPGQVDYIISITQANFWGNARGRDGKLLSPTDDEERRRPLIPRTDAVRIVNEAHKYGLALWCDIDWKPTYLKYMQVERANGWNEKQIAFVGVLFGATQGNVLRWIETPPCGGEDRLLVQKALDAEIVRLSAKKR